MMMLGGGGFRMFEIQRKVGVQYKEGGWLCSRAKVGVQ